MTPPPVTITSMTLAHSNPLRDDTLLGNFAFTAYGFAFKSFALVLRRRGVFSIIPPVLHNQPGRSVAIIYSGLRQEITEKAVEAYRGMGGMGAGAPGDPIPVFSHGPRPDPEPEENPFAQFDRL